MDKRQLTKLINHPGSIDETLLSSIDAIQKEHSYFSAVYLLSAKGKKELNKSDFQTTLQKAALYATNRALLKSYILNTPTRTEEQTTEKKVAEPVAKQTVTPPVVSEASKEVPKEEIKKAAVVEQPAPKKEEVKEPLRSAIVRQPIEFDLTEPKGLGTLFYKELAENMASLDEKKKKLNALFDQMEQSTPSKKVTKPAKTEAKSVAKPVAKETKPVIKKEPAKPKKVVAKKETTKKVAAKKAAPAKKKEVVEKVKKEKMSRKDMISSKKIKLKKETNPKATEQEHLVAEIAKKKEKKIADKKVLEQSALIDKFIATEPQITKNIKKGAKSSKNEPVKDLSEQSTFLTDDLVSENLAQIFVKQGKISQAIDIYKKLIWKFPQKKSYFATQIEKLTTI